MTIKPSHRIKLISIDELKEGLPGYNPNDADKFHLASAKAADALLDAELKKIKNQNVILMCGGSASGKTEFLEKFFDFSKFDGIVFDGTSSNLEGVKIKIKKIKKSGNNPVICLIIPNDLKKAFAAFNERNRKIPEHRFFETHCGAREVAFFIARNYTDITIHLYLSIYCVVDKATKEIRFAKQDDDATLIFAPSTAKNNEDILKLLSKIKISEEELRKTIMSEENSSLLESLGHHLMYKFDDEK